MILAFTTKVSKGKEYIYYQAGNNSMYICPKDSPGKARQENVIKALDHALKRMGHYLEAADDLLPMLPPELRKEYVTRRANLLHLDRSTRLKGGNAA